MSHTCIRYMDDNTGRDVYIVKTKASNIELVNLTSSSYPQGQDHQKLWILWNERKLV